MRVIKHKGELFEVAKAGPWRGAVPLNVPERRPVHRWDGGRIPLGLVRQVTAFFEWSLRETGGETVVHLYYSEAAGDWKAAVLPQKGHTGMSVSLLEDHPGRIEAVESLGPGYELAGTWHHHCGGSAFQSGTDKSDETDVFGLHVTVGGIGKGEYSLHARCSFRKHFTDAALSDWIELPGELPGDLPDNLVDSILLHYVCQPQPEAPFPEEWKANVIKAQPQPVVLGGWDYHGGSYYRKHFDWERDTVEAAAVRPSIKEEVAEFAKSYGLAADDLERIADEYAKDDILKELLTIAGQTGSPVADVLKACDDLAAEMDAQAWIEKGVD